MNILVACEESQEVCKAFREKGHLAFSCDILPCSGGKPEWHIKGDVLDVLKGNCGFYTERGDYYFIPGSWHMIIAFPPCTYLTITGNRWFDIKKYGQQAIARKFKREEAVDFFYEFVNADCKRIAIENPIGIMSSRYRKPDQIIQPYMFGHSVKKSTCLWLKGLPKLKPTNIVQPGESDKNGFTIGSAFQWAVDENGKTIPWNDPRTAKLRSKTFHGVALAMAEQWG